MKQYPQIDGPSLAPKAPCIAFFKYDGSNLRFEWSKKRGFYKFGTRKRLFDQTDEQFGDAIELFKNKYATDLEQIIRTEKQFRGIENFVAFCEYLGPNSFAGWHDPQDQKDLILFDLAIHKRGFILPRDFVNTFGHLQIAQVVYEGNFNTQFIEDIKNGLYVGQAEGVVAKGIIQGKKKSSNHGLWMSKVKTKWWLDELKRRMEESTEFRQQYYDNLKEQ